MRNFLATSETLAGTDCETPYSELDKHWKQECLINPFVPNGCIGNEWVNIRVSPSEKAKLQRQILLAEFSLIYIVNT